MHFSLRLEVAVVVTDGLEKYTFTVATGKNAHCGIGADNRAKVGQLLEIPIVDSLYNVSIVVPAEVHLLLPHTAASGQVDKMRHGT